MAVIDDLRGRVLDTDSHEFTPARLWPEVFGEITRPFADWFYEKHDPDAINSLSAPVDRDDAPIDSQLVDASWGTAAHAPGAWDMKRRLEVLDHQGVDRQFVFPTGVGLLGFFCCTSTWESLGQTVADLDKELEAMNISAETLQMIGRMLVTTHNDWSIATGKLSTRLLPVALLDTTDLDWAMTELERVLAGGVRAIGLPSGVPPGGKSPGHADSDRLYAVLEEAKVPLLFHTGGDLGFLRTPIWSRYGEQNDWGVNLESPEISLNAYTIAQMHMGTMNALTAMIFGGVFDRFPELMVASIETGSWWIGPMAENLDFVGRQFKRQTSKLSLRPSEFVQRNVRCSPFHWEPIDKYIDRYGLEDVYVYGSDYPHFEGGKDPFTNFAGMLDRLGPTVAEKFFHTNALALMR